ncbi:hypothetical protein ACTFIY_005771 [Dictyostelium cf. discoideum]
MVYGHANGFMKETECIQHFNRVINRIRNELVTHYLQVKFPGPEIKGQPKCNWLIGRNFIFNYDQENLIQQEKYVKFLYDLYEKIVLTIKMGISIVVSSKLVLLASDFQIPSCSPPISTTTPLSSSTNNQTTTDSQSITEYSIISQCLKIVNINIDGKVTKCDISFLVKKEFRGPSLEGFKYKGDYRVRTKHNKKVLITSNLSSINQVQKVMPPCGNLNCILCYHPFPSINLNTNPSIFKLCLWIMGESSLEQKRVAENSKSVVGFNITSECYTGRYVKLETKKPRNQSIAVLDLVTRNKMYPKALTHFELDFFMKPYIYQEVVDTGSFITQRTKSQNVFHAIEYSTSIKAIENILGNTNKQLKSFFTNKGESTKIDFQIFKENSEELTTEQIKQLKVEDIKFGLREKRNGMWVMDDFLTEFKSNHLDPKFYVKKN